MEAKFVQTGKEYSEIANKLRNECIEYLTETVKKNGRIEFDTENDDEYFTVTYDGGRHPEYATNAFSTCYAVDLDKNGHVFFEIEDCDEYEVTRATLEDIYTAALTVYYKLS